MSTAPDCSTPSPRFPRLERPDSTDPVLQVRYAPALEKLVGDGYLRAALLLQQLLYLTRDRPRRGRRFSTAYLARGLGWHPTCVSRALRHLAERGLLLVQHTPGYASTLIPRRQLIADRLDALRADGLSEQAFRPTLYRPCLEDALGPDATRATVLLQTILYTRSQRNEVDPALSWRTLERRLGWSRSSLRGARERLVAAGLLTLSRPDDHHSALRWRVDLAELRKRLCEAGYTVPDGSLGSLSGGGSDTDAPAPSETDDHPGSDTAATPRVEDRPPLKDPSPDTPVDQSQSSAKACGHARVLRALRRIWPESDAVDAAELLEGLAAVPDASLGEEYALQRLREMRTRTQPLRQRRAAINAILHDGRLAVEKRHERLRREARQRDNSTPEDDRHPDVVAFHAAFDKALKEHGEVDIEALIAEWTAAGRVLPEDL